MAGAGAEPEDAAPAAGGSATPEEPATGAADDGAHAGADDAVHRDAFALQHLDPLSAAFTIGVLDDMYQGVFGRKGRTKGYNGSGDK